MGQPSTRVFWIEGGLAFSSAATAMLTLLWHDWIEIVFRVEPDHGGGTYEWSVALAFAASTVVCGTLARRDWGRRRHRPAA
jgi:hypothetical protein